jgi:prepilin-type N-terminal cleavage/methylation domain-containing protein
MAARRRAGKQPAGFTLLEALVSMVIFGIITLSLSLAFSTAIRSQQANTQRFMETGTVRVVLNTLSRDIQSAYASALNPASVFIANGGQSSSASGSTGLLTLMTRSYRIQAAYVTDPNDPNSQSPASLGSTNQNNDTTPPQSDIVLVQYDLDTQSGTLHRTMTNVPNQQSLSQNSSGGIETVVSTNIVSLTLRFWDSTQQNWRTDWDYQQQNQPAPPSATAGTTGQTGASGQSGGATGGTTAGQTSGASTASSQTTSASGGTVSGDPALPSQVEITIVVKRQDGTTATYQSIVPILANLAQDGVAPLTNPPTSTTGSTQTKPGG